MFRWLHFADYEGQPDPMPGFDRVICPSPTFEDATRSCEATALANVARARRLGATAIIYDLETPEWRVSVDVDEATATGRLDAMASLADMTKRCGAEVGFYGLPIRANWPAIRCWNMQAATATPEQAIGALPDLPWVRRNHFIIDHLRHFVDFVCPSLYTFYDDDGKTWFAYAREHIRQARTFSYDKLVVPFIWPGFHPSTQARDRPMPMKLWMLEVATVQLFAGGAVVYGGRRWRAAEEHDRLPWDDEARSYFAACRA